MKQKGNIGVTTENIFPVIKKFLYSDHEIFLRELVSNAVDATQKLKTLSSVGEFKGELGDTTIRIAIDKKAGTLTISDKGIGMTEEEIDKYINQIAFSGAEEFLEKYKNDANAIIGHFGLGFYSAFMVSKKVEIVTKSYKENAVAMHWVCDGNPEYQLEACEKNDRGTDIILHIDDENKDFLENAKIEELLKKYCKFLPVAIAFGKKKEWKEGKEVETDEDNIVNNTTPAWTKKPSDLTDEDYKNFYNELYPYSTEPLFHIHLNVDYPFNLTGILYFPKVKSNLDLQRNKIQLYCNQVFVTDSVEGIVPDFLTLLHGVIDSPDIPLNVSRSYLQSDQNVKKISSHITKKVAERLQDIFKNDRKQFEEKWDSLQLFIVYGMLTDEKFYEKAKDFVLLKNSENQYFTLEEYKKLIEANQTDKDNTLIYLYANNAEAQHTYIQAAKEKGYDVLILDGQLDVHFINQLEQKLEKTRFVRVDSDIVEKLIVKNEVEKLNLTDNERNDLSTIFSSQIPKLEKTEFIVSFENLGENARPIVITQNEFMRRMKDMSAVQGGGMMNFYGEMPDSFNLVVNATHPLIRNIINAKSENCDNLLKPFAEKIAELEKEKSDWNTAHKDVKKEDIPSVENEDLEKIESQLIEQNKEKRAVLEQFAANNDIISQLIDLALLSNNMLKGESLDKFIKRSLELIR
ncbi:MAG: molecular chaperone HtpG [Paludibacteraceae bacterium]|nr:molecular chaperone HtpG [Paludibacteraceae bacterium]